LLEHQRDFVLQAEEGTAKIGVDDPVPLLYFGVSSGSDVFLNACIVEGDIKTSEGLDFCLEYSSRLLHR
jgi:hypothetical protein